MNKQVLDTIQKHLRITNLDEFPDYAQADILIYAALAEWLRNAPHMYDPLMERQSDGVTLLYLESQASSILQLIAEQATGTLVPTKTAAQLARWMIQSMREVGELSIRDGIVYSSRTDYGGYTARRQHMYGTVDRAKEVVFASGLCLFTARQASNDSVDLLVHAREVAEQNGTLSAMPLYTIEPCDAKEVLKEIVASKDYDAQSRIYAVTLTDATPKETCCFLLRHAWPCNHESFLWDKTYRWLIPEWVFGEDRTK